MKKLLFFSLFCISLQAQKTENIVLITLDGLRWQEVFSGADPEILNNEHFTENIKKTSEKFWDEDPIKRREVLMPFIWSKVAKEGLILGNRNTGSKVDITNSYGFSYPGYNEILTGYADKEINSNDKNYNKNVTFLEYLNKQENYSGQVAAFCTWDVFPFIINDKRSGVSVSAGVKPKVLTGSQKEGLLNEMLENVPSLASSRFDFLTYYLAKDYVVAKKPKILFIAFDETDEFAHESKYREYLYAANTIDGFIEDLWNHYQSIEQYKGKTTFIITTDHGRGDAVKEQWTSHGTDVKDCSSIWLAAIGPDIPNLGESKSNFQFYQNQIASTLTELLGYKLETGLQVGPSLEWPVK